MVFYELNSDASSVVFSSRKLKFWLLASFEPIFAPHTKNFEKFETLREFLGKVFWDAVV
jgi:hypothetical protein